MTTAASKRASISMNVSASDYKVEVEHDDNKSPVLSGSENGSLIFFEDSDADDSAFSISNDEDPWMEQMPSIDNDADEDSSSVDSTLQELALDDLKRPQPRRNQSDGAVVPNSYQTYNHIHEEMGRSTSLTAAVVNHHETTPVPHMPHATPFRPTRRPTAFHAILPVEISPARDAIHSSTTLEAIAQQAVAELKTESQEEGSDVGPSFREFALLSWNTNKLSLLADETRYPSDGRAYCLADEEPADFFDIYPQEASRDCINPQALSKFCFPNGLRIQVIPRVAMPGAMRMKWAGVGADSCHILVFTNGNGQATHGVAITVRKEVPLTLKEKDELRKILRFRQRRSMAASVICRWWKRKSQNKMLKQALVICKLEGDHSIEELRAELSTSELKLLQENLRDSSRNNPESRKGRSGSVSGWQTKSLKKMMKSPQKLLNSRDGMPPSPSVISHNKSSENHHAEVESVTKNALRRLNNASVDGDCGSEVTDDTAPSEASTGDSSEGKKRSRLHKLAEKMVGVQTPPMSPVRKRSISTGSPGQAAALPEREISDWAREKGRESYRAMKHAAQHGNAVVVEQCYVLVGCRPDEHTLLLGPLQQLVNAERKEINDCRAQSQGLAIDAYVKKERALLEEQQAKRHLVIEAMLDKLRLTRGQAAITFPRSNLDYIMGGKHYFETVLPIPHAPPIKLPLPLPSIGKQWGLSRLLLDIGHDSLVLMLKLLLMERSILVLGENLGEVSAYACSLLELLEPFEWSSVFLPVLPSSMLDFVTSPVPFVAGMAVNDYARVCQVEKDSRTLEAMGHGMSLLNLSTKTLHITSEPDISKMLSLDPYLREQLGCIRERLQHLAENPSSSLLSFNRFIRHGFSSKESVALDSACMALEHHFSKYCGDLAVDCTAWKQYGTIHVETGKFDFCPEWFLNRMRADQVFHETMVKTQLFMGYVDERRRDQLEVEDMRRGTVGKFIAEWIYERWLIWKERNSPVEV